MADNRQLEGLTYSKKNGRSTGYGSVHSTAHPRPHKKAINEKERPAETMHYCPCKGNRFSLCGAHYI